MDTHPKTSKYYTKYLCQELSEDGLFIGPPAICNFGDSATIKGIRIDGKVCLTLNEAIDQVREWNRTDGYDPTDPLHYPPHHCYQIYAPEVQEAGLTPLLPGMTDKELKPRTKAQVGHVVGQGGECWCGELHRNAVKGDNVSLPDPPWLGDGYDEGFDQHGYGYGDDGGPGEPGEPYNLTDAGDIPGVGFQNTSTYANSLGQTGHLDPVTGLVTGHAADGSL